jgi:ferrochelatase
MNASGGKGILLMNLGSPESTSVRDVRRYLNEFLMDERVIDVPLLWRFLLVRGIISPFRAPKSAEAYRTIWTDRGSPLIELTRQLTAALQQMVVEPVEMCMRYGTPSPKEAFDIFQQKHPHINEVVLVPLYPHYAMSSYETAAEYAKEIHKKNKYSFTLSVVQPFYDDADYVNALAETIRPHVNQAFDHLLFSYHGVPERHILKGDITGHHCLQSENCCAVNSPAHAYCYRHQVITTTKLVAEKLALPVSKFSYSFQSRLGRDEWLKPYTAQVLAQLPGAGVKKLIIVCPAFISDCLETLEEIAIGGKEIFMHAGGEMFHFIPCLNVQPDWVNTLKKLTRVQTNSKEVKEMTTLQ